MDLVGMGRERGESSRSWVPDVAQLRGPCRNPTLPEVCWREQGARQGSLSPWGWH